MCTSAPGDRLEAFNAADQLSWLFYCSRLTNMQLTQAHMSHLNAQGANQVFQLANTI